MSMMDAILFPVARVRPRLAHRVFHPSREARMELAPYPVTVIDSKAEPSLRSLADGRTKSIYIPFFQFLFDPQDTIEFRPLRDTRAAGGKRATQILWKYRFYCIPGQYVSDQWIYVDDQLERPISTQIAMSAENHANLYFGVCPRFGSKWFNKAWQTRKVNCLWADLDNTSPQDAINRVLEAKLPHPSAIVNSGHGVHLYWRLGQPVVIDQPDPQPVKTERFTVDGKLKSISVILDERGEKVQYHAGTTPSLCELAHLVQDVNAGIASLIGGDHTKDLARLLRIPGTMNRKDEEQGREPVPCELIELNLGRVYDFNEFRPHAERSPLRAERTKQASIPLRKPTSRLGRKAETTLQQLVTECAVAEPPFRSTRDFHLCAAAIENGWAKETVWEAASQVGKFAERGRDYFELTWAKAEHTARAKVLADTKKRLKDKAEVKAISDTSYLADPSPNGNGKPDMRLEEGIADLLQLDVLGWDSATGCRVFARSTRRLCDIKDVARLTREHCLALFGVPAKRHIARNADEVGPTRYPLGEVRDAISLLASRCCANTENQSGNGIWRGLDENGSPTDEIIIVSGSDAYAWRHDESKLVELHGPRQGGRTLLLGDGQPWCDFRVLEDNLSSAKNREWCERVVSDATRVFDNWQWSKRGCPPLVTALVMATWTQTIWQWRPMISLTGASRSGKSTLINRTIAPMFNGLAITSSDASAAGIRQELARNATVVLLDEFDVESGDKHKAAENRKIQKMFRMSGKGDQHLRGTPGQRAISGRMQHIPWFGGIVFQSTSEADANRFISLSLEMPTYKIPEHSESSLRDLGLRLLAISIRYAIPAIKAAGKLEEQPERYAEKLRVCEDRNEYEKYKKLCQIHSRVVQGYSAPVAILAKATGRDPAQTLEAFLKNTVEVDEIEIEDDNIALLGKIASATISIKGVPFSVARLLREVAPYEAHGGQAYKDGFHGEQVELYKDALESHGIKLAMYMKSELHKIALKWKKIPSSAIHTLSQTGVLLIGWKKCIETLVPELGGQRIDQSMARTKLVIRGRRRIGKGSNQRVVGIPFLWFYDTFMGSENDSDRPYYLKSLSSIEHLGTDVGLRQEYDGDDESGNTGVVDLGF
jgi:hypothetical protein